ncbi:MAG: class I SAM-dependent methyltransferase [Dehalococcoidales bacterium]|nr:class I SAM-dependent methyltransferase [Dehalococcoidales bacterium]
MIEAIKSFGSYVIYRTVGTVSVIRWIEWRKLLEWLQPEEGEKVLDIACGAGELSLKIAGKGCEVYGIDMSAGAIEFAGRLSERAKTPCKFGIGDAEHLPYPEEHFDKIVCSSSLEHFNDDGQALREMSRVLKPGGKVVLTVDSLTYPMSAELKDRHRKMHFVAHYYTRETLKESLNIAGLELRRSSYLLNSFLTDFFYKLRIRYRPATIVWLAISLFGYPVLLISDKFFGRRDAGYTLIAEAIKSN